MIATNKILEEMKNHPDFIYNKQNQQWQFVGNPRTRTKQKNHLLIIKAYTSWIDQGSRCNNKNNHGYKYYGQKGIKRIWSSIECINFYINEFLKRDYWINPVVSRIGDKGNYELNNCKLIECSENSKEREITQAMRLNAKNIGKRYQSKATEKTKKKVKLINVADDNDILLFNSARDCDRYFKLTLKTTEYKTRNNKLLIINNKKYKPSYVNKEDD